MMKAEIVSRVMETTVDGCDAFTLGVSLIHSFFAGVPMAKVVLARSVSRTLKILSRVERAIPCESTFRAKERTLSSPSQGVVVAQRTYLSSQCSVDSSAFLTNALAVTTEATVVRSHIVIGQVWEPFVEDVVTSDSADDH